MRDTVEFDEFYRGTRQRVLQYLYAVSADLPESQDAAAEAYARAWQRWATVRACTDPEAWVRVVAWRILANRWRKLRGRLSAYRRHGVAPPAPPPTEDAVALATALRGLPLEQRTALVLFHILELPVAAIAEQTGVPVGTVKARLSRGRHALAALLAVDDGEAHHV